VDSELRNFLAPVCFSALLLSCDQSQSYFIVVPRFRNLCYRRPWTLAVYHHVGGVLRAGLYIQLYQVLSLRNLPLDTILTPCILPHKDTSAVHILRYIPIPSYQLSDKRFITQVLQRKTDWRQGPLDMKLGEKKSASCDHWRTTIATNLQGRTPWRLLKRRKVKFLASEVIYSLFFCLTYFLLATFKHFSFFDDKKLFSLCLPAKSVNIHVTHGA
jgi:hypothetical protein